VRSDLLLVGELEHGGDDGGAAFDIAITRSSARSTPSLFAGGQLMHEGHGVPDGAERIAQLVADGGGDLADGRQPLRTRQLLHRSFSSRSPPQVQFGILALGDVGADPDDAALGRGGGR